jgi:hypothetical protein
MPVQAQSFVLRQDEYASQVRVDAIREGNVDDAVERSERNGGFGSIAGKGPKAFALPAGEENSDGVAHLGHDQPPDRAFRKRAILTAQPVRDAIPLSPGTGLP